MPKRYRIGDKEYDIPDKDLEAFKNSKYFADAEEIEYVVKNNLNIETQVENTELPKVEAWHGESIPSYGQYPNQERQDELLQNYYGVEGEVRASDDFAKATEDQIQEENNEVNM